MAAATLLRRGVELGALEEFETWMETRSGGAWSRRCLFAMGPPLVAVNLKDEGLGVRLPDGTCWDLVVQRFASGANRVHVTSALLEPPPRNNENAAA
ncbi:MAG TPA: hypothetical protein VND93_17635 [Myxococcales bacterium]|nr:hypothetical protein [Myxococcales bacterium]